MTGETKGIYEKAAKERMKAGVAVDPSANLHEGKGRASDQAAKAFGVGGLSVIG